MSQETQRKKESINSQRLEKLFSSSRDLTLSSSKNNQRTQKTFAPNLNVSRNKNADKGTSLLKDEKKGEVKQRRNNKDEKASARKGNNYVQTYGILSEGIAYNQEKYESSRGARENNNSDEATITRPKIIKQEETLSSKKSDFESEQILASLIGDDEEDSKKNASSKHMPIKIKKYAEEKVDVQNSIKIKKEPIECDASSSYQNDRNEIDDADEKTKNYQNFGDFAELFTNYGEDQRIMMIFQFPDALPGKTTENEDDIENHDKEEKNESNLQVKSKMPKLYSLSNVDEGLIGKIIRHRSGKTKFIVGDEAVYNITRGVSSEFQQNLVVIDSRAEERSTYFYNFGPIKTKFVCSPDWSWLISTVD